MELQRIVMELQRIVMELQRIYNGASKNI